jgi:hypothetical protein
MRKEVAQANLSSVLGELALVISQPFRAGVEQCKQKFREIGAKPLNHLI